jgi:hypothetical protein
MTDAPSSDGAPEEVTGYVGLVLSADDVRSLYEILAVPRLDTAILSHLKAAHHVLGDLPNGQNWWDKVHADMLRLTHHILSSHLAATRIQHPMTETQSFSGWSPGFCLR